MRFPNRQTEIKLRQRGYHHIAGLDEAGKGAWAGPVVAGAVILNPVKKIYGLRDSKLLTALARERLYEKIINSALAWSVGMAGNDVIDSIGLTAANLAAMADALKNLKFPPDYLLIDAVKVNYRNLPYQAIIDGDYKITSIAAASIVAKVTRDRLLCRFHEEFPQYGFDEHKGYGTKKHQTMLGRHGICRLHRQSFRPIKSLINR